MIFQGLGVVFLIFGLLFLISPDTIVRLDQWGRRVLFSGEGMAKNNKKAGLFLLVAGVLMFLFAYWVHRWNLSVFFKKLLL